MTGERLLDGRAVVPTETEALLAADHHEAAALVPDVLAHRRHVGLRQLDGGDVGQDDPVVLLEAGHRGGQPLGSGDAHVDVLRAERGRERRGLRRLLVDEEHLGPPAHDRQPDRAVVLLDDVAVDFDERLVDVGPRLLEPLPIREDVLARGQAHDLGAEELAVPVERQPAAPLLGRLDHDLAWNASPNLTSRGTRRSSTMTSWEKVSLSGT